MVDWTRECLTQMLPRLYDDWMRHYRNNETDAMDDDWMEIQFLFKDLENITATHERFLLGPKVALAKS